MKKKFFNFENESFFYIFIIITVFFIISLFCLAIFYLSKTQSTIFKLSLFNIIAITFSILFFIFLFYRYIKQIAFYSIFLLLFLLVISFSNKFPLFGFLLLIFLVFLFIKSKKLIFQKII